MLEYIRERIGEATLKKIFFNNLWLKLISLGVAIIAWFYVYDELSRMMRGITL